MTHRPKPCALIILDGWGVRPADDGNAIALARTPRLDALFADYPHTLLACSGPSVGLPEGIMGNSEVGHLNIGAGRVVYQDLMRINLAIRDGSFFENPPLAGLMDAISGEGGALHLMGLVSDGGVHSDLSHLLALMDMARGRGVGRLYVHAILDGRDTPPDSGAGYVKQVADHIAETGFGAIATVCGRFYAMDRDTRWERIEKAYRLYAAGEGEVAADPVEAIRNAYARGETDEFVRPVAIAGPGAATGAAIGGVTGAAKGAATGVATGAEPVRVRRGDGIIFFNFRADRAREITRAFTADDFPHFPRPDRPDLKGYVCMTQYDSTFNLPAAFPPIHLTNILGQAIQDSGLRQLRIAETEKYAHVTYFFNGGREAPFDGEERRLIPSPREVETYDEKPEMSAAAVADEVVARIESEAYDLIVLNFANMDMVGHTGVLEAAIRASETVDACVGRVTAAVLEKGGVALITADHGNAEMMKAPGGGAHTAHTTNPVPFVLADPARKGVALREGGILGDIAPTVLAIMGLDQPAEMTGKSLIAISDKA